jgi:flavin-binding protein dodecin
MTVEKCIDLTGTAPTIEQAVAEAVDRAGQTLDGITGFTIKQIGGVVENGAISYRVHLRVAFVIFERFHE